jgi:cation:H+ antiporter
MVWLVFVLSAAAIVYTATQLARYGDVLAIRTRLGGMFIGLLLLAGVTSLPEVLTSISAINLNAPNLAAGNLLGSNAFNMLLLAVLDLVHRKTRILRRAALKHALSGSLTIFLIGLVLFFMLADIRIQIGWVGLDSLLIIAAYVVAVRLIRSNMDTGGVTEWPIPQGTPSLLRGAIGFLVSATALVFITPIMVRSSAVIAEMTGLGTTFIGTTLVATVTSLPEMVTTLAAARIGADDMAIGNLFGSNLFNMFAVGLTDVFYTSGRFLAVIDPSFLLVGMLGLLMTGLGLIGNLARLERRVLFIEVDALTLILMYFAGMWLLYSRGLAP